jgi:hypothetical protein
MRRLWTISALAAVLLMATGVGAAGQFRERIGALGHPLVGTWVVDIDTSMAEDPPGLLTIQADGTLRLTSCCDAPGAGAWRPTTRRTADATLLLPYFDEDGFVGHIIVRADVVLSIDGLTFTATYTQEIPDREGGATGQLGPSTAAGTRLLVEAIGDPVGPAPVPPVAPEGSPTPEGASETTTAAEAAAAESPVP